jgi:hypothetical protein
VTGLPTEPREPDPHHPSKRRTSAPLATGALFGTVLLLLLGLGYQLRTPLLLRRPAPYYAVGEELPNVRISRVDNGPSLLPGRLRAVVDTNSCSVLAFFHSECPICHGVADEWRNLRTVDLSVGAIPITWIGVIDSDTGAAEFLRQYELPGGPTLRGRLASHRLGVVAWPRFIVVGNGLRYLAEGPREPALYSRLPACQSLMEAS